MIEDGKDNKKSLNGTWYFGNNVEIEHNMNIRIETTTFLAKLY